MKKIVLTICFLSLLVFACKQEIPSTATAAPSGLSYAIASTSILKGDVGSSVAPDINNGGGKLQFTLNGTAVSGISLNSSTGVITWSSALGVGSYNIVVLATNSMGSCSGTYSLIVKGNGQVTAPLGFSYSPSSSTIVSGTIGASVAPQINNGGGTINYALNGTIPAGISIHATTGIISWSNSVATGNYTLNVTATNSVGSTSTSYGLTVSASATVSIPSSFAYSPATGTSVSGTAGASSTPSINNGLGTITYALNGTIPTGISINASTGVINWNNTLAVGNYVLTAKASNSAGSVTTNFTLSITAPAAIISFSAVILPVMTTSCGGCHSYTKTYAGITANLTGCASIQDKIGTTYCGGSRMPVGANPLPATYIADFKNWIAQGKLNN